MLRLAILILLVVGGLGNRALASAWSTSSHMGYAVNRQSSTGFEKIGGTMAFFDASRSFHGLFDLGIRTLAQGSRSENLEFYRLGSGPVLGWLPAAGWRLEAGVAFFRESGLAPDGQKIYKSQGHLMTFGWERSLSLGRRVSWSYGSFLLAHRGSLDLEAGLRTPAFRSQLAAHRNHGFSQGAQLALRIQLD